jgi:hypothetical protein
MLLDLGLLNRVLIITPSPPVPKLPIDPSAVLGARGFTGLIVFCSPWRRLAPMNACSPAAVSALTGAGDGGGALGLSGFEPPIIARLSLTFEKSQAFL